MYNVMYTHSLTTMYMIYALCQYWQLQSLTGELESSLSPEMLSLKTPLKPYLDDLAPKHTAMASLFHGVSKDGAALTEVFKPTNEMSGDNGRAGRISSQISNLDTHCHRVEQLWRGAWERVETGRAGEGSPSASQPRHSAGKTGSRSGQTGSKTGKTSKTGQTSKGKTGKTGHTTSSAKTAQATAKTATVKTVGKADKQPGRTMNKPAKDLTSPTARHPPSSDRESSLRVRNEGSSSKAKENRRNSSKRQSEIYGDLEAEAYKVDTAVVYIHEKLVIGIT